ncbi:MAG: hypothetical protein FWE66_00315 [Oscillospiraceae bacterium]|nr:hypothetical protein [Oscillospiraceae bacterium]
MNGETRRHGLNKREKMLIMITAAIAIVALGLQFVILPLNREVAAKRDLYDILDIKALEVDEKLQREAMIIRQHQRAEDAVGEMNKIYPNRLPNEEIDRVITRLCMSNGLSPQSLQIGTPNTVKLTGEAGTRREASAFCTVLINMSLSGDFYAFRRLVDDVNRTENIRFNRFSYNLNQNPNEDTVFSVVFEMTMLA